MKTTETPTTETPTTEAATPPDGSDAPVRRRPRRTPPARLRAKLALIVASCTVATTLVGAAGIAPADALPPSRTAAGPSGDPIPTGATEAPTEVEGRKRTTPRSVTGREAIDKLGRNLGKVAAAGNLSTAQLEDALLDDHTLRVSEDGTLEAADTLGGTGASVSTGASTALLWPAANTFTLHSRPSSPLKIYLDFTGHTTTGTAWNTQYGASFTTPVWGRDAYPTSFSSLEASTIQQAYASVTEDFAPFNVDVTTQDPGVEGLRKTSAADTSYGIRVVVGVDTWMGVRNSGYAKIGSFNWATDTPAYCFTNIIPGTKPIAECISHEAGHTLGLYHDGTTGGQEYYGGHANWAPIMGNSYSSPVTQWSKGQYPGANNGQDDLYVIAAYTGWVADDYAGTTATAGTLPANTTRSGQISWGSGEADAFRFSLTGTRTVNIQSWEWFQAVDPNLNLRVRLTNASGTIITTNSPTGTTRTNMNVTLGAGTYYVFVDGVGEGTTTTGYTNYGSLGIYNLYLQFV